MIQAVEAVIDPAGNVQIVGELQPVQGRRRAIVTVLDDPAPDACETALLSEAALADGWSGPEEDAAWAYLQSDE